MLRYMHRIQRHVLWVVLVGAVALAMTGFGVGGYDKAQGRGEAAVVNGTIITLEEVAREAFATKARYAQIFGDKAEELIQQLGLNIESQATDDLIDKTLIEQQVDALGLVPPQSEVVATIKAQLASAGFNVERFRTYLRQMGMTEADFQVELAKDIKRGFLATLLSHVSEPSQREMKERKAHQSASFDIEAAELSPALFAKEVAEPTAQEIERYYVDHETDFQVPAQVAFDYIAITPDYVVNEVLVDDEEVERYYREHQGEFQTPAQATFDSFSIPVPAGADVAAISALQEKVSSALARLQKDRSKEAVIVKEFGLTKSSKRTLADKDSAAIATAITSKGATGFLDAPVSDAQRISIVEVTSFTPAALKTVDDVRATIEKKLKQREAPAYAATKAQELYTQWTRSGSAFTDFVRTAKLGVPIVKVPLVSVEATDVKNVTEGLRKGVAQRAFLENAFLVEDGVVSYVVTIVDKKESTLKPLASVTADIKEKMKAIRSMQAMRAAAEQMQAALVKDSQSSVASLTARYGVTAEKATYTAGATNASGVLKNQAVVEFVKSALRDNTVDAQPIYDGGKAYIVKVLKVRKKDIATINEQIPAQERASIGSNNTRVLLDAFIAHQKAHSTIELKSR